MHQACRNGLVAHLEQLLFYMADMNTRNASGNSPLHVCAVNNQESCARTLLFRGADKEALNYAGQTAYQVAVIAGNLELGDVIQKHKPEDVGEFIFTFRTNTTLNLSVYYCNKIKIDILFCVVCMPEKRMPIGAEQNGDYY